MILHLLSLMRWEWFKLRHRWFPWVLLVIFILFSQMLVWVGYLVYRSEGGGEPTYSSCRAACPLVSNQCLDWR